MKRIATLAFATLLLSALPLRADDPAPAAPAAQAAAAAQASAESSAGRFAKTVRQGGKTMVFIGLLSVLGLGCALERFVHLRRSRFVPAKFAEDAVAAWDAGKFDELEALCSRDRSILARVVETMLEHRDSRDYAEVKLFAEDKAGREIRLESRKASMLATVATLAPLLGLFGTVLGLLEAFGTVAEMGEMGDASVLADSIGKALVTTVAGLAVSMPALFVHSVLRNRLSLFAVELEEEIGALVNRLFIRKTPVA